MWKRKESLAEGVDLFLGDCRAVLPTLGKVDAVVTDPPYGLGKKMQGGTWGAKDHNIGFLKWDLVTAQDAINDILKASDDVIIWGGNYYALPPARCWLIWNKVNAVPTMADFEQAWTSIDKPSKRIDLNVGRVNFGHPTEKPLELMEWCLRFVPDAKTIVDPFMGSGTTGVAAVKAGRKFIGIEINETYFDIACRRIEDALKRPDLFIPTPAPKPKQESLL